MDIWKFRYLLKNRVLYMRRADLLQDRFEGTFSRRQITEMETWLRDIGCPPVVAREKSHRDRTWKQTYISCWCLGESEFGLVWKAYVGDSHGIAVKSTVGRLAQMCDEAIQYWPLDVSTVSHVDHAAGQHIDYVGLAPFL